MHSLGWKASYHLVSDFEFAHVLLDSALSVESQGSTALPVSQELGTFGV